jgi:hypothetical protein
MVHQSIELPSEPAACATKLAFAKPITLTRSKIIIVKGIIFPFIFLFPPFSYFHLFGFWKRETEATVNIIETKSIKEILNNSSKK